MKKTFLLFLFIQFIGLNPDIIWTTTAQAANTGASFLKIGVGARAIGMGGAFSAIADDVNAIHWNPAGISQVSRQAVSAMHTEWIADVKYDFIGYVYPGKLGTFGGSLVYLSQGTLEGRDENRQKTGEFAASDMALTMSYARSVEATFMTPNTLSYGINLKIISQQIEYEQAIGAAADLGLLIRPNNLKSLQFGLSLQNLGPQMSFISEGYNLPLSVTVGAGYVVGGLTIALDIKQQIYEGTTNVSIGTEYLPVRSLALRAGYLMKVAGGELTVDSEKWQVPEGLGAGFGFSPSWRIGINIDYSFVPYGSLGDTHRISFSAKF